VKQVLESDPTATRVEIIVKRTAPPAVMPCRKVLSRSTLLLANFSTPYDARLRGRTNNLRMAAKLVNGTVVRPEASFRPIERLGRARPQRLARSENVCRWTGCRWRRCRHLPVLDHHLNAALLPVCRLSNATRIRSASLMRRLPATPPFTGAARISFSQQHRRPIYVQTFVRGGRFHARLFGTQPAPGNIRVESRIIERGKGTRSEAYRVRETSRHSARTLSRDYYNPNQTLREQTKRAPSRSTFDGALAL
jgi:hypothetical protein